MPVLSLRKKFIIGTALLIALVGCALALLVRHELHARFQEEVHKRGLSIARFIAEAAEIPLITENRISLQLLVNDYRKSDKDVDYIYIVGPQKEILIHTFGQSFPVELRAAAERKRGRVERFEPFASERGLLYDVSIPIQNGALGAVHIGLYESVIHNNVQGVLAKMLPFVLLILGMGVVAAMLFASAITRPIALLIEGVQQVSRGDLDRVLEVGSKDEIGQLAAAFNRMTENLRLTTVSREFMEKLIDTMNDVLVVITPEGVVMSVNRAYYELFGSVPSDVIGRGVDEFDPNETPARMFTAYEQSVEDGRVQGIECLCYSATGARIPLLLSLAVMRDEDGAPQAVICAAQDISAIKQVQAELHRKQAELEDLNHSLEKIVSSRTAELAITNEGLRAEVSERIRTAEELRAARDIAEAASRAKTEFLANMSHEMRTPLNSIIGGAEYLETAVFAPDQQRCLEMIRRAGDSLLLLVNDLIDLSRIEAGQLELVKNEFNLADTLETVARMLGLEARQKQLTFSLELSPDLPHIVIGDQARLQQIMVNLVANAIKFTGNGGTVTLSARLVRIGNDSVQVTFTVRDTGIGIEADKIDMIFESFAQADSSITRRFGGSGLGLAISRRLVESMGGAFQVESVPGIGSSFTFSISFSLVSHGVAAQQGAADSVAGGVVETQAVGEQPSVGLSRVLLVDDSLENRELMRLLLSRQPLILDEANNGREAVDLFEHNEYALILMDIQMPIMDGFTATQMMRRTEERRACRRTPIVALTAHAYEADIRRCKEAGCDDHIAKPFKKMVLLQCLARHIRGI
ncbi:MAG: response regulator, partial [Verrucomicrobia bacterium]|nr:response regulator [Deltaproteobacteria bacterium]